MAGDNRLFPPAAEEEEEKGDTLYLLKLLFFFKNRVFRKIFPPPRQHWAPIGRTKNGKPIGMTAHCDLLQG